MNESIFKLFDSEIIIVSMKTTQQQKVKTIINKFNKFSNEASEEDNANFKKCFL